MKVANKFFTLLMLGLVLAACTDRKAGQWQEDFQFQPVAARPSLEVNYTDSSRTAFQILAEEYELTGQLEKPHLLVDQQTGEPWLWMEIEDANGKVYSTRNSEHPSRINLYRRGPYFCEVHWLDIRLATEQGDTAALNGDLALYCYPEKMLAEIRWHGTGEFPAKVLHVKGIAPMNFALTPFRSREARSYGFPVMGEEAPLSHEAFELIAGDVPFRYDSRKGYYIVGTYTEGAFQGNFYDTPNRYETATFRLTNDEKPRKIYICHESAIGGGQVEGGMVLREDGHAMPIVVQVSKNFGGEKEEKYYNPVDTPFSETYFPLYLEPGESMTLSSLHLYQNWGRHMTKHWSSLGAWMDYFHSSTGVTETTCYVPFKFAGLGGVSIADFRAMSQKVFWRGQPQHDNLAGHSFLDYHDGERWQNLKYEGTIYRSTGPNWFDIQLLYTSTDSCIRAVVDIWETPQADETRSFFMVRYEVLKPLQIDDARANFRMLNITSSIQRLRFTRFAANGIPDLELDPSLAPFPVKGHPLPAENAYVAEYGDSVRLRGSNAIILRTFKGPGGLKPAATMQWGHYLNRFRRDQAPNTRLMVVPDADNLALKAGDVIEINGYWLPYGPEFDAETPRRELGLYGAGMPSVTEVSRGELVSHLPVHIRADRNRAEFRMAGGKDLVPVIITGLKTWEYPRIWKKEKDSWRLLSHARNDEHDGYQVFCDEEGSFGAVFLVHGNDTEQHLRVSAGKATPPGEKIRLSTGTAGNGSATLPPVDIAVPGAAINLSLSYPGSHGSQGKGPDVQPAWKTSEGQSIWFESHEGDWERGGRISPNEDDLDLEYWWQNNKEGVVHEEPLIQLGLQGTLFEDPECTRTWILQKDGWTQPGSGSEGTDAGAGVIAVQSADGHHILALAFHNTSRVISPKGESRVGLALEPVSFPLKGRHHVRGKVFLMQADLDVIADRVRKEMNF
jgi:hypothetical protein